MASIIEKAKETMGMVSNDTVKLAGHNVYSTGYGLMGLTWRSQPPSQEKAFAAIKAALDSGANFWNGGVFYSSPDGTNSMNLLTEYFKKYPEDASKIILSIKGGLDVKKMLPNGTAEYIKNDVEKAVQQMEGKKIDIFQAARVDPETPIEITMKALTECVEAGLIGGIGMSECSAKSIRRAAAVAKIDAVEVEFSLFATDILENDVAKTCAELDIPIVAYSPLGSGFLTGKIKSFDDMAEDDHKRHIPRFQGENFRKNLELVHQLEALAKRKGCTPGQIGIAWIKAQSKKPGMPTFIPIPGAGSVDRVKENTAAVELSANDEKEIDSILAGFKPVGARSGARQEAWLFGNSPELKE